jgi:phospholipase C
MIRWPLAAGAVAVAVGLASPAGARPRHAPTRGRWPRTCAQLASEQGHERAERRESAAYQRHERALAKRCARRPEASGPQGIHKIKHVVIIMQENRSFDDYFGTYPGADGIPGLAGNPGTLPCVPDPNAGHCDKPYHDTRITNAGGPHYEESALTDIDGGKMDGFIKSVEASGQLDTDRLGCTVSLRAPNCVDVMGYHTGHEIPNYWTYAKSFVLQDHMFEPSLSWSLVSHLYLVSAWSALCSNGWDASTCAADNTFPDSEGVPESSNPLIQDIQGAAIGLLSPADGDDVEGSATPPDYAWTDVTYLLYKHHISWRYYIERGTEPDCANGAMSCPSVPQVVNSPEIWNPLPDFADVHLDNQIGDVQETSNIFTAAKDGTLPAVAWVTPSGDDSEHPPATILAGQEHVTSIINAIMRGPDWNSTAIFLAWDDWGGFYDSVVPPRVDGQGYGLRVPGLVISPYAKAGYIDHHIYSFDAYLKFIEDDFLGGQRLDPKTDGRPDPRPDVRENASILGNLVDDFDFNQAPRKPLLLNPSNQLVSPPGPN